LTVKNTVFERNVVYNVQLQNFGDAPAPQNVLFDGNSFGCAVDWAYFGDKCDGQAAIQFDGYFPTVKIVNNVSTGGLYGCYVGACGGFAGNVLNPNRELAESLVAPVLP
jgi:hypothetical protein